MVVAKKENLEYTECKNFAIYLNAMGFRFTHIPNETWTPSFSVKAKNKAMWVSPWVPDYMVIIPARNIYNREFIDQRDRIVFIEMKRINCGIVSDNQRERINALIKCDIPCKVCKWFLDAKRYIEEIMDNGKEREKRK